MQTIIDHELGQVEGEQLDEEQLQKLADQVNAADKRGLVEQAFIGMFSETATRVLLAVEEDNYREVMLALADKGLTGGWIGVTGVADDAGQPTVRFGSHVMPAMPFGSGVRLAEEAEDNHDGVDMIFSLTELKEAWTTTLPALFSHAAGNNSVV